MTTSQFKYTNTNGEPTITFTATIGSQQGSSKNCVNGLANLKRPPVIITFFDELLLDGRINMYKIIDDYLQLRKDCTLPKFLYRRKTRGQLINRNISKISASEKSFLQAVKDNVQRSGCTR